MFSGSCRARGCVSPGNATQLGFGTIRDTLVDDMLGLSLESACYPEWERLSVVRQVKLLQHVVVLKSVVREN